MSDFTIAITPKAVQKYGDDMYLHGRISALKHCLTFCHLKEGVDPFDTYWLARIEIAGRTLEELRKAEKDAGLPLTYPEGLPLKWPLSIHR